MRKIIEVISGELVDLKSEGIDLEKVQIEKYGLFMMKKKCGIVVNLTLILVNQLKV